MEHPGDCTKYFDCRDKNQMIKECTYPKLYSPTQQACLDFQDVQCNGRREYKAPCEYTLTCTKDQPSPTSWVILNIFFNVKLIPFLLRKNMALLRYLSMFAKRETKRQPKQKCIHVYCIYTNVADDFFPREMHDRKGKL